MLRQVFQGRFWGYSLSTAFGAVLDNPNLIACCVVGDGEAETGSLATAWHSNKFLNPKTSGAVLPIVHINGYKICNPTVYGTMSDDELLQLFSGYGYEPMIVGALDIEGKMLKSVEAAYQKIRKIQKHARRGGSVIKPRWPVILLKTLKGWKGIKAYHGHPIEGSFHAHGIPIGHPNDDPDALPAIKKWLESYKIGELLDMKGRPYEEVLEFVPSGKYRIGMNKHAVGGNFHKSLKLPNVAKYEVKFKKRGEIATGSMGIGARFLRDIVRGNKDNFRLFCPDEAESNKLGALFEATKRAYVWPTKKTDEDMAPDGRVMEMLSENTLQGWLQGYLLTGRHGVLVSYEAFLTIIASMVDQYAKFLKQSFEVSWRKPIGSAIYLLSSLGWRQDHNGYSHQNPSFVSNVLLKHGKFSQIYYPADANSLLVAFEETMKRKNSICVIVGGKTDLPVWQTLKEAREQAKIGIGLWEWVGGKEASKNPDVVLASAGDYLTQEALNAVKLCHDLAPELKIRYVNVSELTSLGLGDYCSDPKSCLTEDGVNAYFTKNKPVIFNYHGYVNDIEQVLWPYTNSDRFVLHGYKEEGSTTTPFDLKVRNGVSCYHLAMDMIDRGAESNREVARKKMSIKKMLNDKIAAHQAYIRHYGDDPEEIKSLRW
ncbi:phosphoketolase family protein [Candidatus Peregrinibacteria bacterium]|nr:phosphoketolase family protein [Candidatus Peregrinibacteria bacterium]